MPIFEYECGSCGNRFEELMGREDPDPACPSCDSAEVTRLISNTSFRLKGSGWYVTDYASGSKKGADESKTKKDQTSEHGSTDRGSASSESKSPSTGEKAAAA